MDPVTLLIIAVIAALIFVLDVYKRQNDRITSNLHTDNLKQLLTLSALEHKFSSDVSAEAEPQSALNEITQLVNSYERGEIQIDAFRDQMDRLLEKYR